MASKIIKVFATDKAKFLIVNNEYELSEKHAEGLIKKGYVTKEKAKTEAKAKAEEKK